MKHLVITMITIFNLLLTSTSAFSMQGNQVVVNSNIIDSLEVEETFAATCLDEYALRNKFLKRFVIWAPPTLVVSLPVASYAYLLGMYGLLWIAPFEFLYITGYGLYIIGAPAVIGAAVAFEVKYSVEYFRNRYMVKVIDSIRSNDFGNKSIKKLLKKFRKKHPSSDHITNERIFSEILKLDQEGSFCNGDLTGSSSKKIHKLLAKKKHLLRYLGNL